jgi:hypothetical protein
VLAGALALIGGLIGVASGVTVIFRRTDDGRVMFRAGWASAIFWVLGMGSRLAFAVWSSHGGADSIAHFSAHHSISGGRGVDARAAGDGGVRGPRPNAGDGRAATRARGFAADAARLIADDDEAVTSRVMLLLNFGTRMAAVIRLAGLAVISWTMVHGNPAPGTSGRRLLITVLFAAAVVAWLWWTHWPIRERGLTPDLYVLAAAGGVLIGTSPRSASAAFVFVAAVAAAVRVPLERALIVTAIGALATAVSTIVYDRGALALLAYVLGFVAAALAASNARQSIDRAEQAELLLAQTQRSYEEQLRTARLEGSARIAREIHDVLAHTLAGLTIQLEATSALLQNGADRTGRAQARQASARARAGGSD